MKKIIIYFCCLFLGSGSMAAPSFLLFARCFALNGYIVNRWTCSSNGEVRLEDSCKILDHKNIPLYFDGCSVSISNYSDFFIDACIRHDLCYHHEPASNGISKANCDRLFLKNMLSLCNRFRPGDSACENMAQSFYSAVYIFGKSSWQCSNVKADYRSVIKSRYFANLQIVMK